MVATAASLFRGIPGASLQKLRPWICPFEQLVDAVPPGSRILDVGCGSGLFLGLLAAHGRIASGVGFDASAAAIRKAHAMRDRLPHPHCLAFETRDVAHGWPDGPFDVVSLIDVMHHVPRPLQPALITEAARKLRPGGMLLYKDMVRRPLWRAAMNRLHDLVVSGDWIAYAPIEDVRGWMAGQGLQAGPVHRTDAYWYGHEMVVARYGP